jgi:elongation factor 1 alpha-like protein
MILTGSCVLAKGLGQAGKGPPKNVKSSQITSGVESMKIDDTPSVKSKNLDVLKEFEKAKSKNAANFVVIGNLIIPSFNVHTLMYIRPC